MKLKSTVIPFILSLITIIGLRIYQFLNIGSSITRVKWDNIENTCVMIALIATAIIIIMSYFSKDVPKVFILNKSSLMLTISIITGLMIICKSIERFIAFLSSNNDWILLCLGISGILAGSIFIMFGICHHKGKNLFEKYRLLTLLPTAWALVRLLDVFFKYNTIPTNITHISSSLSIIFAMFFFFDQARLFAGLFNESTLKKIYFFGFSSVLFILTHSTNELLTVFDLGKNLQIISLLSITTNLCLAIYIICFTLSLKLGTDLDIQEKIMLEEETHIDAAPEVESENKNINNDELEGKTWAGADPTIQNKYSFEDKDMNEVNALIEDIKREMNI